MIVNQMCDVQKNPEAAIYFSDDGSTVGEEGAKSSGRLTIKGVIRKPMPQE